MKRLFILLALAGMAWGPVQASGPPVTSPEKNDVGVFDYAEVWAQGALHFYQTCITEVDGHQCPMTPSCSHYSQQAFHRFGFWKGALATLDRLMRCRRDLSHYPPRPVQGALRYQDPPIAPEACP